ncbi:MAG: hypothetical protein LAT67_09495 [Balneolales bacterium]|nr:hypothetical protein [Balneolales bacterium]
MKKPVFEEIQYFGRNGLWFAMVSVFIIILYAFFQMTVMGVNQFILLALVPSIGLFFFLVLFFRRMKLHVRADERALEFIFYPVQQEFQVIEWEFIDSVEVVETSPIRRLVGWGLRFGPTRAFTIGGHEGVEISFPNGRKLFLGSKRANELYKLIRNFRNKAKRSKEG